MTTPTEGTPGTGAGGSGTPCSYCGSTYFEPPEDNGRVQRVECEECGGTMVSSDGGYWQPDLIGQPDNHPSTKPDPRSGGVPGIGNVPQRTREEDLSSRTAGVDWCRHRRTEHCWLPHNESTERGFALYTPQDRGVCPWTTASQQQINCPMSEPGPMAGMSRAAVWTDDEWRFHVLARWSDVRAKAKRIRSEGGVSIVSSLADGMTGHVNGDTGVYETQINYVPGSFKIGFWQCGCAWASYAWGRSPAYRKFEGRMCSHALALTYEAQARGMFGRQVTEDTERPGWMRDKVRVRHDRDTRDHDVRAASLSTLDPEGVYPTGHGLALDRQPLDAFVAEAYAVRQDPADALRVAIAAGLDHTEARAASDRVTSVGSARVSHLQAHKSTTTTPDKPSEPTHAGVVLKAQDTGRVLMIQRSHQDEDDPAAGTWEFPGGGREEGDHTSLHSGIREFEEEVGHEFPTGGHVQHVWQSPNGVYQGHVVVIPEEKAIDLSGGRRTVNPDDPDGDDHEQSAWWDPDHARKNPALRPECKTSPWDKIKAASLQHTADYASHDALEDVGIDWRPKAPPKAPEPADATNPGSTGFATAQDPPEWENASERAETMTMSMWSSFTGPEDFAHKVMDHYHALQAEFHDEPEPALPSTTADDEVDDEGSRFRSQMTPEIDSTESLQPNDGRTASAADIVARFQATAAAQALQTTTDGGSTMDIAAAAREHLAARGIQRTALKDFSAQEQAALISEGQGQRARNFGDLKIEGTHYEAIAEAMAKEQSLTDAEEDLFL
jgi:8-oxo-dGTP pyrophosphatase MutT (NUDIX family)